MRHQFALWEGGNALEQRLLAVGAARKGAQPLIRVQPLHQGWRAPIAQEDRPVCGFQGAHTRLRRLASQAQQIGHARAAGLRARYRKCWNYDMRIGMVYLWRQKEPPRLGNDPPIVALDLCPAWLRREVGKAIKERGWERLFALRLPTRSSIMLQCVLGQRPVPCGRLD